MTKGLFYGMTPLAIVCHGMRRPGLFTSRRKVSLFEIESIDGYTCSAVQCMRNVRIPVLYFVAYFNLIY